MKVLLITSKEEDYLQDSIIHGFKSLFGKNAVDLPSKEILYDDYKHLKQIRGGGFTLYGLLREDFKCNEIIDIERSITQKQFDLIVFTSIYRQYELFYKYSPLLREDRAQVWIMDGEDSPVLFPYLGRHLKRFLTGLKPHKHFLYFKREISEETVNSIYLRFPVSKFGKPPLPANVKPISFSIPKEKITTELPVKTKLFASQIVDAEVAGLLNAQTELFKKEYDYYRDIQASRFAITTRRAGWDCLRHYEIAANGTVMCFKNLHLKPENCAPHGLTDGENCISYVNYNDLMTKVNQLSEKEYQRIQHNSLQWAHNNSTVARVKNLINNYSAMKSFHK